MQLISHSSTEHWESTRDGLSNHQSEMVLTSAAPTFYIPPSGGLMWTDVDVCCRGEDPPVERYSTGPDKCPSAAGSMGSEDNAGLPAGPAFDQAQLQNTSAILGGVVGGPQGPLCVASTSSSPSSSSSLPIAVGNLDVGLCFLRGRLDLCTECLAV